MTPDLQRRSELEALARAGADLLVVGGGITGAGVARDASLRGLSVALIDKGDWAAGTSSRSSKLVHGGLRYLEHLELGLVVESTRERHRQRRLNPRLVWPVSFVMPVYGSDKHGLFKLNLGLWLYDLLALFRAHRRHRRLGVAATMAAVPGLGPSGLRGAIQYYDCRTDDARLVLANARATRRQGGSTFNYVRFERALFSGGRVEAAELRDQLTGARLRIPCKHIVFAAGPWTDRVPDAPGDGALLRPTKGVHVVVARDRLPVDCAVAMSAPSDGRATFALPFEGVTYIGTTDTDHEGDPEAVRATRADIDYLLDTANRYFPEAKLTPQDIRATWAGLRPLIRQRGKSAYRTSREHQILDDPRGLTTIVGGKLTTYRAMAQELVDRVAKRLTRDFDLRPARCRTHRVPLEVAEPVPRPEGDGLAGPADPLARALYRLHGGDAAWVRSRLDSHPAEAAPLCVDLPYVMAQVSWAVLGEQAWTLSDVLVRRLPVFYLAADQGLSCAERVAGKIAALLERGQGWIEDQLREYRRSVDESRAWRFDERDGAALAEQG